jgi:hypothetical protein
MIGGIIRGLGLLFLFFLGKTLIRVLFLGNTAKRSTPKNKSAAKDDNIIDAEYTVVE